MLFFGVTEGAARFVRRHAPRDLDAGACGGAGRAGGRAPFQRWYKARVITFLTAYGVAPG